MDGGDRAGYKQISRVVEAVLIGPSTGSTDYTSATGEWGEIYVLSSKVNFAGVTAAGLINSSKITSATTWLHQTVFACNGITAIKISSGTSGRSVIAYKKVLL